MLLTNSLTLFVCNAAVMLKIKKCVQKHQSNKNTQELKENDVVLRLMIEFLTQDWSASVKMKSVYR